MIYETYKSDLTAEYVRSILDYNPETGILRWKVKLSGRGMPGKIAGSTSRGYVLIGINGKDYRGHRLAWLWMTGEWPKLEIDHINGDGLDNRWCNLREATRQQNVYNSCMQNNNSSLYKGVHLNPKTGRWYMVIRTSYETQEEAALMYNKVAAILFGEYAYLNEIKNEPARLEY